MDRRRAAGALLALAACVACSTAAPTASDQTALELLEGPTEGCYYNFQHYGEGDRIMTNEPCLNCTCHNRMLMCYLRVCPFTKPIGQDCTIEKRADQCCPIVTCPDVPVDLLTSTSTSSPAEYGATGLGKVDKYGCSINGKYFSEGSKVPPTPNKPCEHCYCIRNMTTCVMQECTLHVDGCTPIYHKDVCCPVRYSCDHQEDEMLLLDDMTTTVRPTPGFLLTTTVAPVTQISQDCVHDDQIFADGASIKTEKACEHCYCMKGDIVCIVQECGTPMENEGKNCTSLPPRQGQCCPDTYICEGDELISDVTDRVTYEDLTTLSPPRRVEGSGYRNEPDEPYTEMSTFEGSGEESATTLDASDTFTSQKETPQIIDEVFPATEESVTKLGTTIGTIEPDKGQNTVPDDEGIIPDSHIEEKATLTPEVIITTQSTITDGEKEKVEVETETTASDYRSPTETESDISKEDELILTTESGSKSETESTKVTKLNEIELDIEKETTAFNNIEELTTAHTYVESSSSEPSTLQVHEDKLTTSQLAELSTPDATFQSTTNVPKSDGEHQQSNQDKLEDDIFISTDKDSTEAIATTTAGKTESFETTSVNPIENEIHEDVLQPGRIPGEGDCLLNGITYKNNTNVPNINNCHSSCKCVSSIVKCDPIICSPPPEHMDNMNDCQPIYDTPDACCPTYVCHSRETIPPESHNQMSETESPKPIPEKSESECHGDQCHTPGITPSPEVCNSEHCKSEVHEMECKDGVCVEHAEPSSDTSPPTYPDRCVGETCLTSEGSCADGKCQQPSTNDKICNDESKCQPSEAEPCIGQNCADESGVILPKDEIPICKDSDGCKTSDSMDIPKPACEGNSECDKIIPSEDKHEPVCTEEGCKREKTKETEHEPQKCFGTNCITQDIEKDKSSVLTTESSITDSFKESATEHTFDSSSKTSEPEETVTVYESHKATESVFEPTEKQDISPDSSTEKLEDLTIHVLDATTEQQAFYTEPSISFITKEEETITEMNVQPEIGDHQTISSEAYTTKSEGHVTEHIEKEVSSESPISTQPEESFTELSKEEIDSTTEKSKAPSPTKTPIVISDIGSHETNDATSVKTPTEFTLTPTETSNILVVTTQQSDLVTTVLDQEYTKKQETNTDLPVISEVHPYTELPEKQTTNLELITSEIKTEKPNRFVIQESERTEADLHVSVTEISVTTFAEILTEKSEDDKVKDGVSSTEPYGVTETVHEDREQVTNAAENEGETVERFTTEHSIPIEHSSELHETKLEDVTEKLYDYSQKDQILTEKPFETTSHDLYYTEKDLQPPQMTDKETVTEHLDTVVDDTEKSIKDQYENTELPEIFETVTNKQDVHTAITEPQEYATSSVSLEVPTTSPSITKEKITTQENPTTETGETVPTDVPSKELHTLSITQDVAINESTTQYPEVMITTSQDITTKVIHIPKDSSEVSAISEDHTDNLLHDLDEISTKTPEEIIVEDTTLHGSLDTETTRQTLIPEVPDSGEQVTSKLLVGEVVTGEETTASSFLLDISTKHTDTEAGPDRSEENTLIPEMLATTLEETEEKTPRPLTTKQVESEAATTESLKQPTGETSDITDKTPIQEEHTDYYNFDKESTEANIMVINDKQDEISSIIPNVDTDENKATVPITVQDSEFEDSLLTSKPDIYETETQLPEKQKTTLSAEHVTQVIGIHSDIHEEIRTEYPVHETEIQNTFTPETDTQTEYHTEISISPTHIVKHDKEQTESPMSLVTEIGEQSTSKPIYEEHDLSSLAIDRTTQISVLSTLGAENIPDSQGTEPNKLITELPFTTISDLEYESKTPSHAYTSKDKIPEVISGTEKVMLASITENVKVDLSTEAAEKLLTPTEYQEQTTLLSSPTTVDSESSDILRESTSVSPLGVTSNEVVAVEQQDISTKSTEIPINVATVLYDSESNVTPLIATDKEETLTDATTSKSKVTGITEIDHTKIYDGDIHLSETEKTISPELSTIKDQEPSDYEHKKITGDNIPSIQEESTSQPIDYITTEKVIYSEKPTAHDIEIQSTVMLDRDITTKEPEIFDVERQTTRAYQDLTTIKNTDMLEVHPTTNEVIMTESSQILIDEENKASTPSSEQFETENKATTNEQITPKLPEVTEISEKEHSYTTQKMSTNILDEESVTSVPEKEHPELGYPTSLPTENEILLQTERVVLQDKDIPDVTETVIQYTVDGEHITATPIHTKPGDREELQTEISISVTTEKAETIMETTFHDDKAIVPIDTTYKTPLESETSLPMESEIEVSTSKEIVTTVLIERQPETSVTQKPVTTVLVESETKKPVTLETDYTVPEETETELFVPQGTEIPVQKSTESSFVPTVIASTDFSIIESKDKTSITPEAENLVPIDKKTETSIQEETEITVPIETETETPISKETEKETPISEKTEISVPVESETETPISKATEKEPPISEETEISAPVESETETPVSKGTEKEPPVSEETEISAPVEHETETPVSKGTEKEPPVSEETEISVPLESETETAVSKGTEKVPPISDETEASIQTATESSISKVTDTLVQSETESAVSEHESTTYVMKDKESIAPEGLPTVSEATYSSSETTPYLVELQEHTNKFDDDISSIVPTDTTKASEIYQTERGDQPIETVTDKTTEEDFHVVHTGEETLKEKDEKSSTPTSESSSDYATATNAAEEILHDTEADTEKYSMSSESPLVTSSGTQINENIPTISPEESSSIVIPTVPLMEQEKLTTIDINTETSTNKKDLTLGNEKVSEQETVHETSAPENAITATKATTIKTPMESTTHLPIMHEKPEEKPEIPKPGIGETPPTEEMPLPDFPTSGASGYGQEPDYVDQEDQAFGPGTCRYGGKVYVSAQQIPRDDPCDFCFCFRSDIICLQQSCPPPIHGCHEEPIQGFCCPRYECPVSMATTLNVTTTTTTTTTTLPPHFLPHAYKGAAQRRGCQIKGHTYKVGDVVRASSGPCLHCTCGGDGQMKCDPKACTPEPMLRQMIAAAVSAKRRR